MGIASLWPEMNTSCSDSTNKAAFGPVCASYPITAVPSLDAPGIQIGRTVAGCVLGVCWALWHALVWQWVTFFHISNFAGVKKFLDADATYYCILHQYHPEHDKSPRFNAVKFEGQDAVFARLDNEMSRQNGNIACVSAPLQARARVDRARSTPSPGAAPAQP